MEKIGAHIRKWREERNLSAEELAELSGLSNSFIKSLEEENLLPSVSPLLKIARALGVRLGTFMDDQITKDPILTRSDNHSNDITMRSAFSDHPSFQYTSLGKGKSDRNMEPFLITVIPEEKEEISAHQGEEFIYVLNGKLHVTYGQEEYTLLAGDSIYYNSIVPHCVNATDETATILAVIYYPL